MGTIAFRLKPHLLNSDVMNLKKKFTSVTLPRLTVREATSVFSIKSFFSHTLYFHTVTKSPQRLTQSII